MRSLVCAQCHVEYYFKKTPVKDGKAAAVVTLPWQTGAHGKNNVSCADCHMPYVQEGGIKYTDHKIGSPLEHMDKTCMNCHRTDEKSLLDNIKLKKDRKDELAKKALVQLSAAHLEAGKLGKLVQLKLK